MCELDIIFNFEKAYFIFDEFILGGEIQETSKKSVLKAINDQDVIQEVNFLIFQKNKLFTHIYINITVKEFFKTCSDAYYSQDDQLQEMLYEYGLI